MFQYYLVFLATSTGFLAPQPGNGQIHALCMEGEVLTMGPPGKPLSITYELKLLFTFVSIICGHPHHCSVYPLPSASDYTGLYWGPGLSLIWPQFPTSHWYDPQVKRQTPAQVDTQPPSRCPAGCLPWEGASLLLASEATWPPQPIWWAPPLWRRSPSSLPFPGHLLPQCVLCFILPASLPGLGAINACKNFYSLNSL